MTHVHQVSHGCSTGIVPYGPWMFPYISIDVHPLSPDFPIFSMDFPIFSMDFPMFSMDFPIFSMDFPMFSMDFPMVSMDFPMFSMNFPIHFPMICVGPPGGPGDEARGILPAGQAGQGAIGLGV